MNRKVISAAVAVAMTATMSSFALPANAAEVKTPQYQTNARQMEKHNPDRNRSVHEAEKKWTTQTRNWPEIMAQLSLYYRKILVTNL